ncbi:pyridoxal phosphate-dependent transferase [Dendryphion nanum]|uniref:Pyridoxal phosphate-dependent transferase n=1 Tax=Dendryphion nanum TaxID=256645 RepID=A0A9P9D484_9PLEO|nr:pyridoxal phosphate-dependent transferase [Dendryphion nanum]
MDSGLSARMARALREHAPKLTAHEPPKNYNAATAIDLSSGQNEVLRSELLEFFKTTVEEKLTQEAFAMPSVNGGDVVLRGSLSKFFNQYFNPIHPVLPEHIVVTAGASEALECLIHSICDDGDSVIVPGPYWYGFDQLFNVRSNVNIIVAHPPTYQNYDNYLLPSLQAAYNFASDRSRIRAVVLCNPQNPLSRCYPKQALVECMEFCQERGLHLVSDEILALTSLNTATISDNAPPFTSALSLTEPLMRDGAVKVNPASVHVVWSASKFHLLTWSQLPTLLALNSERLTASYALLAAALRKWNIPFVPPTMGLFVFARLGKNVGSVVEEKAFFSRLAVQGVRVGQGRFFGGVEGEYGWGRVRFGVRVEEMSAVVERIGRFLEREG